MKNNNYATEENSIITIIQPIIYLISIFNTSHSAVFKRDGGVCFVVKQNLAISLKNRGSG